MSKRPELTAAERALPYAKFYDLPITPHSGGEAGRAGGWPHRSQPGAEDRGPQRPVQARLSALRDRYCVMPNGTGFLANRTEMPGVTPEMFEWWFAWH